MLAAVFFDHASSFIIVEHKLGFSASETIWAKQKFEKFAFDNNMIIENYLADNGIFSKSKFLQDIRNHHKKFKFCGKSC